MKQRRCRACGGTGYLSYQLVSVYLSREDNPDRCSFCEGGGWVSFSAWLGMTAALKVYRLRLRLGRG